MTHQVQVTLIGGPTVVIDYAGLRFMTDPTFDEPGVVGNLTKLAGPALSRADVGHIDVVLLSHDEHADNLDVAGRALLAEARHVLTTPEGGDRVPEAQGMKRWDQAIIPGGTETVTITAVPARHGPSAIKHMTGQVTGFVLEAEGWPTVYVSGDNSSVRKASRVAERFAQVDVAIVFAGAAKVAKYGDMLLTMDAERLLRVGELWPEAVLVPAHIEDWAHFSQPRSAFVEAVAAAGRSERVTLIERGETRLLGVRGAGQHGARR